MGKHLFINTLGLWETHKFKIYFKLTYFLQKLLFVKAVAVRATHFQI